MIDFMNMTDQHVDVHSAGINEQCIIGLTKRGETQGERSQKG